MILVQLVQTVCQDAKWIPSYDTAVWMVTWWQMRGNAAVMPLWHGVLFWRGCYVIVPAAAAQDMAV